MTLRELFAKQLEKYETDAKASMSLMHTLLNSDITDDSDEAANIAATFTDILIRLETYPVEDSNTYIVIQKLKEMLSPDDDTYIEVSGYNIEEGEESIALEYTPWKDWLNMHISPKSLEDMGEEAILAACMFEMTFCGYTEEDILKSYSELVQQCEDVRDAVDRNGGMTGTISMPELLKELGIDNDEVVPMIDDSIIEQRMEDAHKDWLEHIDTIKALVDTIKGE